jgi:ATP-dependent DNA helicase DinG
MYDVMKGRMFALFTSYSMLEKTYSSIKEERGDISLLKQGDLPRYVLLDVFKKNNDTILLGTTTFWQGVDVPGEHLECVMITKLPFTVPTDPVNSARIERIRQKGGNPFNSYQLPQAVMMFKQGFGRLIRTQTDRGIIAVLDGRILSRSYGKEFIKALPKCRRTDDIRDIKTFWGPFI